MSTLGQDGHLSRPEVADVTHKLPAARAIGHVPDLEAVEHDATLGGQVPWRECKWQLIS